MTPSTSWRSKSPMLLLVLVLPWRATPGRGDGAPEAGEGLRMTPAVACKAIDGYEAYDPLPDAALTSDEKLLVYYRPLGYRVERAGPLYTSHLTQDGRIRRRGSQAVLLRKAK